MIEPKVAAPTSLTSTSRRLLLVEDHADTAIVLAKLLERDGLTVDCVGTVADAMSAATSNRYDLILCDLSLPDGSGHDLIRRLRLEQNVPAIALSGYGMEDDIRQSHEAGFNDHLTKPVSLPQLRQAIQRVGA
jgi:CheY-like chemotaxis protein